MEKPAYEGGLYPHLVVQLRWGMFKTGMQCGVSRKDMLYAVLAQVVSSLAGCCT